MSEIPNFEEFLNEDKEPINEAAKSLVSYYSNSNKSVKELAKKIESILEPNRYHIGIGDYDKLVDLINDLAHQHAIEYSDNKRPW